MNPKLFTVLFGGGLSLLNQDDPTTGTLYTGSADATYVWDVTQPSSPDFLTQLRGGFRVQDISSDGLGTVENGWEWMLEYQTDSTWTFSWYSVTSGSASAAIQTQTNIGTVTNVRVMLDGNSVSVETSANNGSSYTSRGSTTSATYQTETGVAASYTGYDGGNMLTNGGFVTGDLTGWSQVNGFSWSVVSGRAQLVTDDPSTLTQNYSTSVGTELFIQFDYEVVSSSLRARSNDGNPVDQTFSGAGTYTTRAKSDDASDRLAFIRGATGTVEVYVDNAVVSEIAALDNASDGITKVVQS